MLGSGCDCESGRPSFVPLIEAKTNTKFSDSRAGFLNRSNSFFLWNRSFVEDSREGGDNSKQKESRDKSRLCLEALTAR